MICFEIISTRISSVIFVNNYAFVILSLAILGLGLGGVFSYYKITDDRLPAILNAISKFIFVSGLTLCLFIIGVVIFSVTNPYVYFSLLFLPFFSAGVVYSLLFKLFANRSFSLYAADLAGAAFGSGFSLIIFNFFNASNAVIFLALILFISALFFPNFSGKAIVKGLQLLLLSGLILFAFLGHHDLLGKIPIGNFPEKDFYHVYPNLDDEDYHIIDSRWSLYGRTDLVRYNHQDVVEHLFIDGAAGTPMYRFNGDPQNPGKMLPNIFIRSSTTLPFLLLEDHEKNNLLVIGPGGGKEILTGLLTGFRWITGVEVNPDIIDVVKSHKDFNGGIYTEFPNIQILAKEGRHFIKKNNDLYNMIVLALPSTEQVQNIDYLATSENFLLTAEALQDYLKILKPDGSLVFTLHNRWELMRLIVTSLHAFEKIGIPYQKALNHFIIISHDYTPTIIIKKRAFQPNEITRIKEKVAQLPIPPITYVPYNWDNMTNSPEHNLLQSIHNNPKSLQQYIQNNPQDLSPVYDDKPYFYKVTRGPQREYQLLFTGVLILGILLIGLPLIKIRKSIKPFNKIILPLITFISIGTGFMILEVTLFQKLILYLGSPTISLAILLSSLLIGMGIGSYFGNKFWLASPLFRLQIVSLTIVLFGALIYFLYPWLLNILLNYSQILRSLVCYLLLIPFGFLLGIPFPTAIELLKKDNLEQYIPWMYGINGIMSVMGSVLAVILSMSYGFTVTFYTGLSFYLITFITMVSFLIFKKEEIL